jgi:hypothetical protein
VERVEVFTVNKCAKTFNRDGSCLIKETEEIVEILVFNSTLTRLIVREDFSRSEVGCEGVEWTGWTHGMIQWRSLCKNSDGHSSSIKATNVLHG